MNERARRLGADALVLAGGSALVASAFVRWVASGDGSGLRGHALIDALIAVGRHFPGLSGARLTVVWYLVPALGALSWVATGLQGAGSRAARFVAVAGLLAAGLALVAFGRLAGFANLGAGAWLAVAGAVVLVIGSWFVAPARPRAGPSVRMTDRGR